VLREPALLLPQDRFIIRKFSPVVTIGGGVVVDTGGLRYRKTAGPERRLDVLATAPPAERLALLVAESPYGADTPALVARTGLTEADIEAAGRNLVRVKQPHSWWMDRAWFDREVARVTAAVREFHRQNPLQPGMQKQDLRSRALPGAPPFLLDTLLAAAADLTAEGEIVRLKTHRVVLKHDEEQARTAIEGAFEKAGLAVPALAEVLAKSGIEPARARSVLQILLREKRLVRVGDDLVFHRTALDRLRGMLAERRPTRFNVSAFKDWTGISRKYAIPLLEYLDREHITRREGDERVVL
jgi:selenocysteine-specific elongation factor